MKKTKCLSCGEVKEVPSHYLGKSVACSSCQSIFEALPLVEACAAWESRQVAEAQELAAKLPLSSIFLLVDGDERGPFLLSEVKAMWAEGSVPGDAQWWINGMKEWAPVRELPLPLRPVPPVPKPPPLVPSSRSMFTVLVGEETSGPFTIGQIRSLWGQGKLTVANHFKTEAEMPWNSLQELVPLIEESTDPTKKDNLRQDTTIPPTQLRAMELSSRMKSSAVAALWCIFLPILGAAYGSLGGSIICAILFLFTVGFLNHVAASFHQAVPIGELLLAGFFFQVVSCVASMVGVQSFNKRLFDIEKERSSPKANK